MAFHPIKIAIQFLIALLVLQSRLVAAEPVVETVFDVGVLALRGHEQCKNAWQPTVDLLSSNDKGFRFKLHTYDFSQLDEAFRRGDLDFVLTSPGQATKFARQFPISWIATQKTAFSDIPNRSIASVALVNAKSQYMTLKDIDGERIGAVSDKAFGGFLAMRYELDKLGYFHRGFFNNVEFTGPPTDQLILDVINGERDAAIVPACTLESLVEEGSVSFEQVRVLNAQRPSNSTCVVSTPLYRNWTLAMTQRGHVEVGQYVMNTLFAMPSDHPAAKAAGNIGWMLSGPTVNVDKVYKHLDLHPLQKSFEMRSLAWLRQHQTSVITLFALIALFILYHAALQWRFKRNQRALTATLNDLRTKSSLLEHAQRITIVGELGSSLAHEINQPLAAIKNYSTGASRRLEQGMPPEDLLPILDKIQQQVGSAGNIVDRLRGLIKKKPIERAWTDVSSVVDDSVKLVEYEFGKNCVDLTVIETGEKQRLMADPIGIQQVILNVLNNAKDACLSHVEPNFPLAVVVNIHHHSTNVVITVMDNGIGFDETDIPLDQPFYTSKEDGLGLGLAICRDVCEAHHGNIRYRAAEPTGCKVTITLPYQEYN